MAGSEITLGPIIRTHHVFPAIDNIEIETNLFKGFKTISKLD